MSHITQQKIIDGYKNDYCKLFVIKYGGTIDIMDLPGQNMNLLALHMMVVVYYLNFPKKQVVILKETHSE